MTQTWNFWITGELKDGNVIDVALFGADGRFDINWGQGNFSPTRSGFYGFLTHPDLGFWVEHPTLSVINTDMTADEFNDMFDKECVEKELFIHDYTEYVEITEQGKLRLRLKFAEPKRFRKE